MKVFLLTLITLPVYATTNDEQVKCLARVMWSEARGESVEGVVAVGQATVNRANGNDVCKVKGVTSKKPSATMQEYYRALARQILATKTDIVQGADSWNTGKKPAYKGDVKRVIGGHVFYSMSN